LAARPDQSRREYPDLAKSGSSDLSVG
jgi:hypothetical protein